MRLARAYRAAPPHDVVLVGYFGHLDVFLARLLAGRDKVVLDLMLSVYDTIAHDRQTVAPNGIQAKLGRLLDRLAARQCRRALIDTAEHRAFFVDRLGIPEEKLAIVPVGADPDHFARAPQAIGGDRLKVLFFGTFVPLQGTPTVAEAMRLVGDAPIDFTIVGTGQDKELFDARSADRPGSQVVDWVPYSDLPALIARHDVVLGIFGTTGKAGRVIPNKVYQAAAVGPRDRHGRHARRPRRARRRRGADTARRRGRAGRGAGRARRRPGAGAARSAPPSQRGSTGASRPPPWAPSCSSC